MSCHLGPASETFARQYHTWMNGLEVSSVLPLDEIQIGQSRTQSSSSLVTDSAAGATAFACGKKSHNGAIGGNLKPRAHSFSIRIGFPIFLISLFFLSFL
jgi:alkaline phosphatase